MSKVSVIISAYNQLGPLGFALESFRFQGVLPLEVIVADDGSADGTLEWLEIQKANFPFRLGFVTRNHEGYRLASLQNLGAKMAIGERLLFTNADVVHCPASVEGHANLPSEVIGAGVIRSISIQGTALVNLEVIRDFWKFLKVAEMFPDGRTNVRHAGQDPNVEPLPVWGGNFSVPRDTFDKVGGFDDGFLGWGDEDADLALRCQKQAGCRVVWAGDSVVYHLGHPLHDYQREQRGCEHYWQKRK
jgi:glycosyltransferase involved in cell wall biosynthesis